MDTVAVRTRNLPGQPGRPLQPMVGFRVRWQPRKSACSHRSTSSSRRSCASSGMSWARCRRSSRPPARNATCVGQHSSPSKMCVACAPANHEPQEQTCERLQAGHPVLGIQEGVHNQLVPKSERLHCSGLPHVLHDH